MQTILSIVFWLAAVAYALSFAFFAFASVFRKDNWIDRGLDAVGWGFLLHTAVVAARWFETGHPPFVSYFESMSASVWFAIFGYVVIQGWKPSFRVIGVGLMPLAVLLMGWAGTHPFGGEVLPVSLQSFWLFIHASLATAAVGCFLVAAGAAFARLKRDRNNRMPKVSLPTAPAERYDEFTFRTILLGFLFYGLMIVSGAIWADVAWGRYWGWDPIELWSLITWLIYAVYLHIYWAWRKLRGSFLAWYAVMAVLVAAFSLWGVGLLYKTIHTYGGT